MEGLNLYEDRGRLSRETERMQGPESRMCKGCVKTGLGGTQLHWKCSKVHVNEVWEHCG